MTEKLYYIDSHMSEFDAIVLSCVQNEKGYEIILDKSAFFPEGGGQPGDIGKLAFLDIVSDVKDCFQRDRFIVHLCSRPLPEGAKVHGTLDFDLRFSRMQNHSGEHIVSGIAHSVYGCNNVGFHMGSEEVTLDFDREIDESQITRLETLANEAVWKNVPFTCAVYTKDELEKIDFRSKKEIEDDAVRLVKIEGYDLCACCAPHVSRSGEIGIIKILGFMKYKGGVRIRMLCGRDALAHYKKSMESIKDISIALSAKYPEVSGAVARMCDEMNICRQQKEKLCRELAQRMIDSLKKEHDGNDNIVIFNDLLDQKSRLLLINAGAAICKGVCAVFAGKEFGYTYVMASENIDLKSKAHDINTALNGKGGGSSSMISGTLSCTKEMIISYFAQKIK